MPRGLTAIDMKTFWLVLVLSSPIYIFGQNANQNSMETLKSLLKAGTVRRVEILRLPDEVMTRTSVTPEAIRSIASYEVIFNEGLESTFGLLLSETSFSKSSQNSDLRWGVLFCDNSGQEVGSIFVDKFGESGFVNKEAVRFNSNLARQLREIVQTLR